MKVKSEAKSRDVSLDLLRGLLIILIVLGHMLGEKYPKILINFVCSFNVPAFFVVSGYLYKKRLSLIKRILKRAKRILIPFVVAQIIFLAADLIVNIRGENIWWSFATSLYGRSVFWHTWKPALGFGAGGPLWFLPAMFVSYILFETMEWIIGKFDNMLILDRGGICGIILVMAVAATVLNRLPFYMPWSIDIAFVGAILIWIGYNLQKLSIEKFHGIVFWGLFIATCIVGGYTGGGMSVGYYGKLSIPGFCLIAAIITVGMMKICMCVCRVFVPAPIVVCGIHSMPILVMHEEIKEWILYFWGTLQKELCFMASILLSIFISMAIGYVVEFICKGKEVWFGK